MRTLVWHVLAPCASTYSLPVEALLLPLATSHLCFLCHQAACLAAHSSGHAPCQQLAHMHMQPQHVCLCMRLIHCKLPECCVRIHPRWLLSNPEFSTQANMAVSRLCCVSCCTRHVHAAVCICHRASKRLSFIAKQVQRAQAYSMRGSDLPHDEDLLQAQHH